MSTVPKTLEKTCRVCSVEVPVFAPGTCRCLLQGRAGKGTVSLPLRPFRCLTGPGGEAEEQEEGGRELCLITFVARTDLLHAPRAARTGAGHQQLVAASVNRFKINSYPGF
ncbi:unnamed protein product [Pleuronectes platessa]|uniref:Uncharacterized protein n=1 Tax=Pleuronectes platessa TaxID=8262 RepID=A0A9N7U5B8_PLEPL|nr:unnamed protein product [Pleuronectes platessa]